MNGFQIVSVVALLAWLALAASGLRGLGLDLSKGVRLGVVWIGIFLVATLFISVVSEG